MRVRSAPARLVQLALPAVMDVAGTQPNRSLGFRRPRAAEPPLLGSRWRRQRGRLEVWYTTFTDPATSTGAWLHHELVAPADGSPPRAHGWATVFPPGAAPVFARFGPFDWVPGEAYQADDVELSSERLRGRAGETPGILSQPAAVGPCIRSRSGPGSASCCPQRRSPRCRRRHATARSAGATGYSRWRQRRVPPRDLWPRQRQAVGLAARRYRRW